MPTRRCCCGAECKLGEDNFNRADSTDVGSGWSEESGDWEIDDSKLVCITPGILATTICHPSLATLGAFYANFKLANLADAMVYRFRAGDPLTSPFEGTCTIHASGGGLLMDVEITNGTDTASWNDMPVAEDEIMQVNLCYYPGVQFGMSIDSGAATERLDYEVDLCIDDTASGRCHSGLGNFSFLEGDFDDWVYWMHWAENKNGDCPYCECVCISGTGQNRTVECWPGELTLTITNPPDCPNIPDTYTLFQSDEPGGDAGAYVEPSINASPAKVMWISNEVEIPESNGHYFRWKLQCAYQPYEFSYPSMLLQFMLYVKGLDPVQIDDDYFGFDDTYPETIDTIVHPTNSRTHALSLETSTCGPIRLLFPPLREYELVCGAAVLVCGGEVTENDPDCTGFEYIFEVEVTE